MYILLFHLYKVPKLVKLIDTIRRLMVVILEKENEIVMEGEYEGGTFGIFLDLGGSIY